LLVGWLHTDSALMNVLQIGGSRGVGVRSPAPFVANVTSYLVTLMRILQYLYSFMWILQTNTAKLVLHLSCLVRLDCFSNAGIQTFDFSHMSTRVNLSDIKAVWRHPGNG